jgi:hypothetical protein
LHWTLKHSVVRNYGPRGRYIKGKGARKIHHEAHNFIYLNLNLIFSLSFPFFSISACLACSHQACPYATPAAVRPHIGTSTPTPAAVCTSHPSLQCHGQASTHRVLPLPPWPGSGFFQPSRLRLPSTGGAAFNGPILFRLALCHTIDVVASSTKRL